MGFSQSCSSSFLDVNSFRTLQDRHHQGGHMPCEFCSATASATATPGVDMILAHNQIEASQDLRSLRALVAHLIPLSLEGQKATCGHPNLSAHEPRLTCICACFIQQESKRGGSQTKYGQTMVACRFPQLRLVRQGGRSKRNKKTFTPPKHGS